MATVQVTLLSASQVPRDSFVAALNTAYSDYYVPIYLTPRGFNEMVLRESVDLSASAAALHDGRIVGMGLLAIRGQRGWIGGMGVVPGFRRQGVGRRVLEHLIAQGRQHSLDTLQLEVITANKGAFQLYLSCGFEIARELLVLRFTPTGGRTGGPSTVAAGVLSILPAKPADVPGCLAGLPSVRRPWQRELAVLESGIDQYEVLAARRHDGQVVGLCLHAGSGTRRGLLDLVATSPAAGEALIGALLSRYSEASFSYLNVAADDPLLPALLAAGFKESLRQYEMLLTLAPEAPH
jgi:ribosomal protein S18 acetylase RimI-like enzyme